MNTMQKTLSVLSILTLVACGGGGDAGGESSSAPAPKPAPAPSPTPAVEQPQAVTTADLIVDADFTLDTFSEHSLDVDVSSRLSGRMFINVCELVDEVSEQLNYQSYLLTAPLKDGRLSLSLTVSNSVDALGAEIVFPDNLDAHEIHYWTRLDLDNDNVLLIN